MKSYLIFLILSFFALTTFQMHMPLKSTPITLIQLLGNCTGSPRVRREIRDLSQEEVNAFINAFKNLTYSGKLDNILQMHATREHFNTIHFTPYFFPWHRVYVRQFEDVMRTVLGKDWALPYWDWSVDSQHPEKSLIFTENYFGANDQAGETFTIINSLMQDFEAQSTSPHLLQRTYKGKMGVFVAASILKVQFMKESLPFSTFSQNFENLPHGIVHTEIGGDMGQMISPNDIIFWLHHAFIDKVWWDWQSLGKNLQKYEGSAYGDKWSSLTSASIIPYNNLPINNTFDIKKLCYEYKPRTKGCLRLGCGEGVDRIAAPEKLPLEWLSRSINFNLTAAQELLNETKKVADQINARKTFKLFKVKWLNDLIQ